ncbi:MAG: two-component regulator propeller domain-containing protein [Bryobacteraceae bacterium]
MSVSALMAVPDGGLWVGFTRGGASFIRNGRVTNYSDSDGFPVSTVRCFARDRAGTIWAAVVGGFARLEGHVWQRGYKDWNYPDKTAWKILVDREGTLWVATGSQIVFLPWGEKRFQSTRIRSGKVSLLTQAPDGAIIFYDNQLKKLRVFRYGRSKKIEMLPDIDISANSAMFDRDGALWVGGDGLSRLPSPDRVHGYRFKQAAERFTEAQGLSNQSVEAILEDREGNIWIGTDGGLDRFRYRNVTWFPLRGGPFSLVAGSGGDVWAGSRGDSFPVIRVGDGKLAVNGPTDVFTVYRDPDGTIWCSGNHSLLHWQNGRFAKIAVPDQVEKLSLSSTPPDPIIASAITKDHSGSLWVAFGGSGEFRLENGIWTFVPILTDHPDWSAAYSYTDSRDRVWFSWGDRIAQYDHGDIRIFGIKQGLAIGPPNVIAERSEEIWVGGESGLAFLEGGRFHTIQSAELTGLTYVSGIVVTQKGDFWLSTGSGIVHIPESEIENVVQHPEHKVAFELFDLVSDLPEPIQRGEVYSSGAIQAKDGTIWFATRNGAVRVDPTRIYRNPLPPPVSIRSIVADDKIYSAFSTPVLPALTKNLRIEYAASSLSISERVRFRYKLQGWDQDWHEAEGRREAFFTHLAPGKYSFRVTACNNDGVWNVAGATLMFTVAPAWFQTIWFRAFCVGVFLLLLWMLYRLRLKQFERQFNMALEVRVDERTRIARELHDTLLQGFNGLLLRFQAVSNLLPAHPDDAKQRIDSAIEQASNTITEGRDAVHELRLSTVLTNDLALAISALAKELAADRISGECPDILVQVEGAPRDLHPILRDEVYRIAGEALRNAYRHSEARRIEVEIRYGEEQLRVRIRDNGKGIDPRVLDGDRPVGHWGLRGMRERAKLVNGRLDVWSKLDSGTEIELTVPASVAYGTSLPPRRSVFSRKN